MVVVADPASIEDVFSAESDALSSAAANVLLKPTLGTDSLLQLEGSRHRAARKLLMPSFHPARFDAYRDLIRQVTRDTVDGHGSQAGWLRRGSLHVHAEMKQITRAVILRLVLGLQENQQLARLSVLLDRLFSIGNHPLFQAGIDATGDIRGRRWQQMVPFSPWALFRAARDELDEVLLAHIRSRGTQREPRTDVLSHLLAARDEHGDPLSDQAVRDQILTVLVAGHKTTATGLTWTLYELASDVELWMRLHHDALAGDHAYLDAAIKEALRLHPAIPLVLRRTLVWWSLHDWMLPPGVLVAPAMFLAHRRSDTWEEPNIFRPSRFAGPQSSRSYFPFGGGTRRCLGAAFALFEMRLILTEILKTVRLEVPASYAAKTVRRGITFALSDGLPVRVREVDPHPRNSAASWSHGTPSA